MTILEFFKLTAHNSAKVKITMNNGQIIVAYIVAITSAEDDEERNEDSLDYNFDTPIPGGFGDTYVLRPDIKTVEILDSGIIYGDASPLITKSVDTSRANIWRLNLGKFNSVAEFHEEYASLFVMPEWYGRNWDAFWDAITGMARLTDVIIITGFDKFTERFPRDAGILREILQERYIRDYYSVEVVFSDTNPTAEEVKTMDIENALDRVAYYARWLNEAETPQERADGLDDFNQIVAYYDSLKV